MGESYFRFVIPKRHKVSHEPTGVFTAVYALDDEGSLLPSESAWWRGIARWFNRRLPAPDGVARSRRPHAPNRAVFWFKASAKEHVSRMREVVALLEAHGVAVDVMQTDRPGYVVYEDAFQVAAEPFRGKRR